MSTRHLFAAMKAHVGHPTDKLILISLADSADSETGECWPSVAWLARVAECSRRTVFRSLDRLDRAGLISRRARKSESGRRGTTMYCVEGLFGVTPTVTSKPGAGVSDCHGEGCQSVTGGVSDWHTEPTIENLPYSEPTVNREIALSGDPPSSEYSAFEAFWKIYPRKEGKKAAEKAFRKISEIHYPAIARDIAMRLRTGAWDAGRAQQYIPHASTYLNQERWEDEVALPDNAAGAMERTRQMIDNLDEDNDPWTR